MTGADRRAFSQAFNRLAVAFPSRFKDDDQQGTQLIAAQQVYFEALVELTVDAVTAGAASLTRTAQFFPAPVEWIKASKVEHRHLELKALLPAKTQGRGPWRHECETCEDSGWEVVECKPRARCNRRICAASDESAAEVYALVEQTAAREQREVREDEQPKPYAHRYAVRCFCIYTNATFKRQWHAQFGKTEHGEAA